MAKQNCWEFKNCGRQEGGHNTASLGVCPASTLGSATGYLDGVNGGRACTYITGTFCGGTIQGTHKEKEKNCGSCDFFKQLRKEHGSDLNMISFSKHVKENS